MMERKEIITSGILFPLCFFFSMLLIPPVIAPHYYSYLKLFIITLCAIVLFKKVIAKQALQITWYGIAFLSIIIYQLISFFWVNHPSLIWPKTTDTILLLIIFLISKPEKILLNSTNWRNAILGASLINIGVLAYIYFEISTSGKPGFHYSELSGFKEYYKFNTNLVATILVIQIPFLYKLRESNPRIKFAIWTLIFITALWIALLNCRGASFSLVILTLFLGYNKFINKSYKLLAGLLGIAISVIGLIVLTIKDDLSFFKSYNPFLGLFNGGNDERVIIWKNSFKLIQENPLLGCGSGHWKLEHIKFGLDQYRLSSDSFSYYTHAHNFLIESISELGIIGILLIGLLIIYPIYLAIKQKTWFLLSLLFLVIINAMWYGFMYTGYNDFLTHKFIWMVIIALLIKTASKKSYKVHSSIFLFAVVFVAGFNIHATRIRINWSLELEDKASYLMAANRMNQLSNADFHRYYKSVSLQEYVSNSYWTAGRKKTSIHHLNNAIKDNPYRTKSYFILGKRYLKVGEIDKAKLNFEKALSLNSKLYRAKIELLKIAFKQKDWNAYNDHYHYYTDILLPHKTKVYKESDLHRENTKVRAYWERACRYEDIILNLEVKKQSILQR